jgi:putative copper export protein
VIHLLYTISVYIHVVAACGWVGSMLFFSIVVVPVLRRPDLAATSKPIFRQVGLRFRAFGWICIAVLLATGTTNLALRGFTASDLVSSAFWADGFGRALAFKLTSVAVVLGLTLGHDALSLRPPSRTLASWLGRSTLLASLVVVMAAVWLVRGMP